MTWFKVDDTLHSHKKAMRAGTEAMGLWVLAGSWAADQLTDGWVPQYAALRVAPNAVDLAERLVRAGLWVAGEHDGDKGWWFHGWQELQPTREEVLQRRKADAERRARWREAKQKKRDTPAATGPDTGMESRGASRRDTGRESQGASALPDPARPGPGPLFEGDPGTASAAAERPPPRDEPPVPGSAEARAVARRGMELIRSELAAGRGRRTPAQRLADEQRAEQDALAELDAIQADPGDDPAHVPRQANAGAAHAPQPVDQRTDVA